MRHAHQDPPGAHTATERDPVCGMDVDPRQAAGVAEHEGRAYYFCSTSCEAKFRSEPTRFVYKHEHQARGPETPAPKAAPGTYTCPMHPDVRQDDPRACPNGGMALEFVGPARPATPTEYVCPMHPEVVRAAPGVCPICGMIFNAQSSPSERTRLGSSRP